MYNNNPLFGRRPVGDQAPPPTSQRQMPMREDPRAYQQGHSNFSRPATSSGPRFRVEKTPGNEFTYQNLCALSPQDYGMMHGSQKSGYVLIKHRFVVTVEPAKGFPPGHIGLNGPQRAWMQIGLMDEVDVQPYDPFRAGPQSYLGSLDIDVGFTRPSNNETLFDQDELANHFIQKFQNQIFAPGQEVIVDFHSTYLAMKVRTVELVDLQSLQGSAPQHSNPEARGILVSQSMINFLKAPGSNIKLKGSTHRPAANSVIRPDFKFEDMGIGGLDAEFSDIFRRAFASRIFPPGLAQKIGIQHVRGILLFGPPGTGKTLIARQIGKMLNAKEPKIVNGPEVLNKFVGQSEENIRKLFADAEKEQKEKGDDSDLHIIIFDELDAVCKQRGSGAGGGTGVGDSVVNQLLSKLDGVEQLNNILLIGMTNRKDMIDEALLRSGRLEVHMEISLPDEKGRQQILKIHTSKMAKNNIMSPDVDLEELARLTRNFSGAEINGLVKSASSFAMQRHIKVGTVAAIDESVKDMKVEMKDFLSALEEVKPLFGVSEEDLERAVEGGILTFSPHIEQILKAGRDFVSQVRSNTTPLLSVLVHGPRGAGKTAIAARIALDSEFPFIKMVRPADMIGMNEIQKIQYLQKVFTDAYKSPLNILVLDDIELLVDWVPIGPRFSAAVLAAIKALMKSKPPKGRPLLILATTSERSVLQQLQLAFNAQIPVPNLNTQNELAHVMEQSGVFERSDIQKSIGTLEETLQTRDIGVGIQQVLLAIQTAMQDMDKASRFAECMVDAINDARS